VFHKLVQKEELSPVTGHISYKCLAISRIQGSWRQAVYLQNHSKIFVTLFPNPGNFLPEFIVQNQWVGELYSCEKSQMLGDVSYENMSSCFLNTKCSVEGAKKLIAWGTVLKMLVVAQLLILTALEVSNFLTVFTRAHYCSLPWARLIQSYTPVVFVYDPSNILSVLRSPKCFFR
jgi:hypothetical protein